MIGSGRIFWIGVIKMTTTNVKDFARFGYVIADA
jgi:hypothetical protein